MAKIEILSPVGNRDMLNAALAAGADAVYLGGKLGSARQYANNFSKHELKEVIVESHLHNTKVYLTMNTLIKNSEMDELVEFVAWAYENDIDAIIIQDLGLFHRLKEEYPKLALHASTQMNIHSLAGVKNIENLGFERVILGRETPLSEIKKIKKETDIKLELFVHGSLCVSLSGQCLLSSFIGGRSGNRGRCAQICRKLFSHKDLKEAEYLLSLRDMNTIEDSNLWKEEGITSLKIEGRMKKPSYVYTVTKAWKQVLENEKFDMDLNDVSARAFTKGYTLGDFGLKTLQNKDAKIGTVVGKITGNGSNKKIILNRRLHEKDGIRFVTENNRTIDLTVSKEEANVDVISLKKYPDAKVNSNVYRIYSHRMELELQETLNNPKKYPVEINFKLKKDTNAEIKIKYGKKIVKRYGNQPELAKNKAILKEDIFSRLNRLGETPFYLNKINIDLDSGLFFPLSLINKMRREAIDDLIHKISRFNSPGLVNKTKPLKKFKRDKLILSIEIDDNNILDDLDLERIGRIYTSDISNIDKYKKLNIPIYLISPYPYLEEDEKLFNKNKNKFDGILAKDLSIMNDKNIIYDTNLSVMNDWAADFLLNYSVSVTASIEMSKLEVENSDFIKESELIAFGPVIAMIMKHCPFVGIRKCISDKACEYCEYRNSYITDEKGAIYKVQRKGGYSYLYYHSYMNRIHSYAYLKNKPSSYRLILKKDKNNQRIINYAADVLLDEKKGEKLILNKYFDIEKSSDINWIQGVE